MDLTGLLGGIQQPQTLSDLANDPRLAGVMKAINNWKTAVRPDELPGYTPIPEGYVGMAYKYGNDEDTWRDVPFAQRMFTASHPSLTPFEGDVPYYSKFIDTRDDDGFLGDIANIATGGAYGAITGDFGKVGQYIAPFVNPGAVSFNQAINAKDAWDFIDAVFDPITGPGINAVAGGTNSLLKEYAPEVLPYVTTLATTLGTIIGGPVGAAAGYGVGSKIAGMPTSAGMIGSALAYAGSALGQAASSALGGLTSFSGIDSIPVDAWGAGMSTPGYATAAQIPGLLTGSFGTADELGLQNIDVGLDTPSFTKTTDFLKTYGSDLLKAGLKIASSGEVQPLPDFNFATNQTFSPNYTTTGNVWETPMSPEEQLKAMAQAQAKKKSLTEDEPKKDTRFAYLKDWVANVPARPEFLSDYLA